MWVAVVSSQFFILFYMLLDYVENIVIHRFIDITKKNEYLINQEIVREMHHFINLSKSTHMKVIWRLIGILTL